MATAKKTTTAKTTTTKKTTKATVTKVKTAEKAEKSTSKSFKKKFLVIVESPAKSKTINKILGNDYQIEASYGHIRDFPPKVLGFDVEKKFEPSFVVIPEKLAVVKKLNDFAKKAQKVYLASDPDREGEAIAWHVRQELKVPDDKIYRIEFNEITPKAVKYAVEHPREIDYQKVRAQQTRQILDRLVGYKISPVLWEKLGNRRLSAGRVQSVALKMIVEREALIDAFQSVEYWSITANLMKEKFKFEAQLTKYKNEKIEIPNQKSAEKVVKELEKSKFEVTKVTLKDTTRKPSAPFITSTLQRDASSKLGYGVSKTMQVAQKLYEGMEIDGEPVGLITYMRTDSVRISDDAQLAAKDFIIQNYGEKYYPKEPNNYVKATKKNIQDAHEAIRPSYVDKTPESLKKHLASDQYKLYKLIWDRFVSSQMENAKAKNTSVDIEAGDYLLKVGTSKLMFDGFLKVYSEEDENPEDLKKIPDFEKGDKLTLETISPKQHFTQPPPRFTEAALVKALEEYGIGRPSTYAPIITKIQTKGYVDKIEKALAPSLLGKTISNKLDEHFVDIMNYKFTAGVEEKLDEIADNTLVWSNVLQEFYDPFIKVVDNAKSNMERVVIESEEVCPNCSKPMIVRTSRFGTQFLGCSGYPECKTMMPMTRDGKAIATDEKTDVKCDKCQSETVLKVGPYGQYFQCLNEECKFRKPFVKTTGIKCPLCEGEIVQRKSKRFGKIFYGCNKYPECTFVLWNEPIDEKCPKCKALLVKKITKKFNRIECSVKECDYKRDLEND